MKPTALATLISSAAALCALACTTNAGAATETALHAFAGPDGSTPNGVLVADRAGNLYGTTVYGSQWGYGTVFELSRPVAGGSSWTERVIHAFHGGLDGTGSPYGLAIDAAGNLFGANTSGGRFGGGVAYELSPPHSQRERWTYRVLHAFGGHRDAVLLARPTLDPAGNLYGPTPAGGPGGCGAVIELSPSQRPNGEWSERTIHSFTNCNGRGRPDNTLTYERGSLYGMTDLQVVGAPCVLFRLSPPPGGAGRWTYADLFDFNSPAVGQLPVDAPTFDAAGNLYGTTESGGVGTCLGGGCGTVFRLTPPQHGDGRWSETVLYEFMGGNDGGSPLSTIAIDSAGRLYGTTAVGGTTQKGTVFALTPQPGGTWAETVLHSFSGGDGVAPESGVLLMSGALYGTAPFGGRRNSSCPQNGCGTAYEVTP